MAAQTFGGVTQTDRANFVRGASPLRAINAVTVVTSVTTFYYRTSPTATGTATTRSAIPVGATLEDTVTR